MSDLELAKFLGVGWVEGAIIIPALTPRKRAAYERMAEVCDEIDLWQAGVGPKPSGVILCGPKQIRGAR